MTMVVVPENYENKIYDYLNNYLLLLKEIGTREEQNDKFEGVREYLRGHTNMCYDDIWELFKDITGENV